jgi:hypothetical protein
MMREWFRKGGVVLVSSGLALLLAGNSQHAVRYLVGIGRGSPVVPFVGEVPWHPPDRYTHFFSGAASLGAALAVALVVAALLEVAKSRLAHREYLAMYLHCTAFQTLVTWAAFSRGAWDWAVHFQSLILTRGSSAGVLDFVGPRWPWLLFAPVGALATIRLAKRYRQWLFADSRIGGAESGRRKRQKVWVTILGGTFAVAVLTPWLGDYLVSAPPWWPSLATAALTFFAVVASVRWYWRRSSAASERLDCRGIDRAKARRWVSILLGTAWLLAVLTPWLTELWFPPGPTWPQLGNVAEVPWSEQAEPRSSTVELMGALAIALVTIGLVETAKIIRIQTFEGFGFRLLLGFQVILLTDLLVSAVPDWSAFLLSRVLPRSFSVDPAMLPGWPWISLLTLIAILALGRFRDCSWSPVPRSPT